MKMTNYFFISALIVSSSLFAQTLPDAIKQTTNEQFGKADASFKALLTAQPTNGEIYFYEGENYFKNDNIDVAKQTYQKGADANATNPFCYTGLGKIQWYANNTTDAKANFYKAITLAAGKNATVLLKIAEVYINAETKDYVEANKLLDLAQKLEPKNPDVYILRGDAVLEQSNDGTKAIAAYEEAAKLDPKSVTATLRIGKLWSRSKNYPAALEQYKKAKLIDSSFAPAYREMAEIYGRAGQYNNAIAQYKRYLDINNDCDAHGRYAGFLLEAKHYPESVQASKEALQCNPNNIYLYRYLSFAQYETGDFANGLTSSETFFTKATPDVKIIALDYEYRAKLYSKNSKDSLAIIAYKKALELEPEKVEFNGDIANTYIKMKKYPEAIAAYKLKMATGKPNANDYFGIGRAYYYSQDFTNADSAFTKIIIAQPDLSVGYLWRAKANSQLDPKNETWQAKAYYEQFITKVKPEDVDKNKKDLINAYTYLAAYYAKQKDCPNTKANFQKVLDLDPNDSQAKKFMATPCK